MSGQDASTSASADAQGQRPSMDLLERANRCIARLTALQNKAERSIHRHWTKNSKELLEQAMRDCRSDIGLLRSWRDSVASTGQTTNEDGINLVAGYFDDLDGYVSRVENTLDVRMGLRYRDLTALTPGSK